MGHHLACAVIFLLVSLLKVATSEDFCCSALHGQWTNQLGSVVDFCCKGDGGLHGTYNSAVGQAKFNYELAGRYTVGTDNSTCIVAWSVSWNNNALGNSRSATSWTGIYFQQDDTIHTLWHLTSDTSLSRYWDSTSVNHDDFKRNKLH